MTSIADALVPVLALIFVGFAIQRTGFLNPSFWPSAEKLTYYLLMPAALIHSLASKSIHDLPWLKILLTVEGTVIASALLVTLWWTMNRHMGGPAFTSLFQGGVRFNTFVALALAENMFGSEGLMVAALGAGFMIVLMNVLCVTVFSLSVNQTSKLDPKRLITDLIRNPLILGCAIGIGLSVLNIRLPKMMDGILALGGKGAFPIGLMAVGAAYRVSCLKVHWQPLVVSSTVQFIFKPLTAWGLATYLGLSEVALSIAVLLFSVPTAPSAYILSRQMGGDHDSMSTIITVQTCLSFVTLPITIGLLR